jgi:hypothetical protein
VSIRNSTRDFSIIAVNKFIEATRDSGYKGTPSAVAELVDNAVQAGAVHVDIWITRAANGDDDAIELMVQDNGTGMSPHVLRQALRFGGSTRFKDRHGLGRYGMGLPNSSLSQARRLTVYTWQQGSPVYSSYLDVDQISSGYMTSVPAPKKTKLPFDGEYSQSGTVVVWSRCDRLANRRISTIVRKLMSALGRQFRYFLWNGVRITVNGNSVEPLDPLFLHPDAKYKGAAQFGEPLQYEVSCTSDNGVHTVGCVRVQFAELPVHEWSNFANKEKRTLGVSSGAGISIVRAGREVDYGWFFLGSKRRENYDDWWRCEIQFDPVLDEAFGITNTKQQIRPSSLLLEALSPDIEATARTLNGRVRRAHVVAKATARFSEAEKIAMERENLFEPISQSPSPRDTELLSDLKREFSFLHNPTKVSRMVKHDSLGAIGLVYKIVESSLRDRSFFTYAREPARLVLALNPNHPFYKQVYRPLTESTVPRDRQLRVQLELLLLSFSRAGAMEQDKHVLTALDLHRQAWSNILATFLND